MKRSAIPAGLILSVGLGFLYIPMAIVIVYAFNDGRLVTIWTHFSFRWFAAALSNQEMMAAARLSLGVAAGSACLATIFGATAALRSRGRSRRADALVDGLLQTIRQPGDIPLGDSPVEKART